MLYIYIIYSWKVETINQLTFCPLCLGQSSWAAPKYQTCAGCLSPTLDLSARRPFEPAFSCAQHILGDCGTPKGRTFVSFIHISSLSPALKCLSILTLARSWSSLVKQFETCWNCVSLSLAKICRAFGLSLNLCHPELIQNGCPSGKCTIEAWIDTSNSMNHKPSAIFEISGYFRPVHSGHFHHIKPVPLPGCWFPKPPQRVEATEAFPEAICCFASNRL
jgi:hypothetical protein